MLYSNTKPETQVGEGNSNNSERVENTGLPRWLSGEESTCQCRKHRFDPWAGMILWRRKWQPTPVLLPGKFHGQRSLAGTVHGVTNSWTLLRNFT